MNNVKPVKPKLPVAAISPSSSDAEIVRLKCEVYDLSQDLAALQRQAEFKIKAMQALEQRIASLSSAKHTNGSDHL